MELLLDLARPGNRPGPALDGAGLDVLGQSFTTHVETEELSQAGSCVAFNRRSLGGVLRLIRTGLGPSSGGLEQHIPQHRLRSRNFLPLIYGKPGDDVREIGHELG
jgi:hypothetical protein